MQNKKIAIIGAGIGGLTTANYLLRDGHDVTIFEKNDHAGGRCGKLVKDGHRFDTGATLLMMPEIYRETYQNLGMKLENELNLKKLTPIYKVKYTSGEELKFSSDISQLHTEIERIEPGAFNAFLRYMSKSYDSYKLSMKYIIDKNYYSATDFFTPANLIRLLKMRAFGNHYRDAGKYFKNELLRILFTFQNIYVGQNPYHASAIFSMLPFLEITDGVWFPEGGMSAVTENLLNKALEQGAEIQYNKAVQKIKIQNRKAESIEFHNEKYNNFDLIVCNSDTPYTYQNLITPNKPLGRWKKLKYTCSAIVYHWGLKKEYHNIDQHNVFVSKDYAENINSIFSKDTIPDDPSFYLHSPVKNDKTCAPENQDSVSVIVPVANLILHSPDDWESIKNIIRKKIFARLEREGLEDFENQIKFEMCFVPEDWQNYYNITGGAIFGSLSHNLLQMGYLRPPNQHKKYRNIFFVGGSTHPGNGVPMVLLSAKLTYGKIMNYINQNRNE